MSNNLAPGKVRGKRFLVFGAARSGMAATRLLRREQADVVLVDEKPAKTFSNLAQELNSLGVETYFGSISPRVFENVQYVVVSPGIPADHALLRKAHELGIPILSEIELGFLFSAAPIVAVTGTNGKTTTATMVAGILSSAGRNAALGGNIGRPFCDIIVSGEVDRRGSICVLEISSFQLEHIRSFRPYIAIVINIRPDHLDRHRALENYVESKARITKNQRSDNFLILNADDPTCMSLKSKTQASVFTFSTRREVERGAFLREDKLMLTCRGHEHFLCRRDEVPVPGLHNVENFLASACAAWLMDIEPNVVAEAIRNFKGVEHRIEFVAEIDGVPYYNDSKATNLDSLEKALLSFPARVILIAGGQYKHNNYDALRPLVGERVKHLILLGEAKPHMKEAWSSDVLQPLEVETMADAVARAREIARRGDVVLLSPGCKSFDQYANFEERGKDFKARVRQLLQVQNGGPTQ
jgi:UDP-N-acetylmuramoylalanine--D-glutamate ligase